jgi:UDP-GlcNAc:undecaprenyl-phosphate GlcNAc-1-phosphate transferase
MARRAARGAPLFSADRGHIHHRLLDLGFSHRQTVLVLYAASIALGCTALALSFATSQQATWFLLALSGVAYLALRRLGYISLGKAQRVLGDRRRNLLVRRELRRIGERLRLALTVEEAWGAVRTAARTVGASAVALHLADDRPGEPDLSEGFDDAGPELLRARYSLFPERPGDTHVELGWTDGRTAVDRDTEIAIELLCDHLSGALERLERDAAPEPLANVVNLGR